MPTLDTGRARIEYSVVRGGSRSYTYFRFRSDLTLEVVIPRGRLVDVDSVIRSKLRWIEREHQQMTATRAILRKDEVMFGGAYLKIRYESGSVERLVPDLTAGSVTVTTRDVRGIKELVRRWFLRETSSYVVKKVAELAPRMGVEARKVDTREIGKWGYCTRSGRLSFSWQLIALPDRLREYVVMHELAHLEAFDHSQAFRKKLRTVCPDARAREKELDLILPYDRKTLE